MAAFDAISPISSLFVPQEEWKGRQTSGELTMWSALIARRPAGQTLLVAVDRGLAQFAWVGESPRYPFLPLVIRLQRTTLLTWGTMRGQRQDWPLYAEEVVESEEADRGKEA